MQAQGAHMDNQADGEAVSASASEADRTLYREADNAPHSEARPSAHAAAPVGTTRPSGATRPANKANRQAGRHDDAIRLDFCHLMWIFVICSFVGLIAETIVSYPIDGVWKDRAGLVWGPLSPIYGAAAVLFTVVLAPMRNAHPAALFAVASLAGGAFEFIAGWFWENAFGIVAWSYIDQPFNIMGYTCLGISLVWGAAGFAWLKLLLPVVCRIIDAIPARAQRILTAAMAAFIALDIAFTLAAFACWFDRQAGAPVEGPVQTFFAEHFSDEFMADRFQTMSMYPVLAKR